MFTKVPATLGEILNKSLKRILNRILEILEPWSPGAPKSPGVLAGALQPWSPQEPWSPGSQPQLSNILNRIPGRTLIVLLTGSLRSILNQSLARA